MPQVLSSAKALIRKDDKFLILIEKINETEMYDLPGGKIEYSEAAEETVKREVKEELDIDVVVEKPLGVWHFIAQNNDQVVCHTFLCAITSSTKMDLSKNPADEEITQALWLNKDEIQKISEKKISTNLKKFLLSI